MDLFLFFCEEKEFVFLITRFQSRINIELCHKVGSAAVPGRIPARREPEGAVPVPACPGHPLARGAGIDEAYLLPSAWHAECQPRLSSTGEGIQHQQGVVSTSTRRTTPPRWSRRAGWRPTPWAVAARGVRAGLWAWSAARKAVEQPAGERRMECAAELESKSSRQLRGRVTSMLACSVTGHRRARVTVLPAASGHQCSRREPMRSLLIPPFPRHLCQF